MFSSSPQAALVARQCFALAARNIGRESMPKACGPIAAKIVPSTGVDGQRLLASVSRIVAVARILASSCGASSRMV